jgi:hypothetical protein
MHLRISSMSLDRGNNETIVQVPLDDKQEKIRWLISMLRIASFLAFSCSGRGTWRLKAILLSLFFGGSDFNDT